MAREFFTYPRTDKLLQLLNEAASRSAVSRGQAFEDFLEMSLCAMSGGRMEKPYLAVVEKHSAGKPGKRGCDSLSALFGEMVSQMETDPGEEMTDPLGDLFQGAITYGEAGQFLTPLPVCRMLVRVSMTDFELPEDRRATISDPCCGSGRMLLAAAELCRGTAEYYGQDVDLRCVKMTVLNLALRNLYGYVVHGNTLTLEKRKAYRTGFDLTGYVREIPVEECPIPTSHSAAQHSADEHASPPPMASGGPGIQLDLF